MRNARLVGLGLLVASKVFGKGVAIGIIPLCAFAGLIFGLGRLWQGWFHHPHNGDPFIAATVLLVFGPIIIGMILIGLYSLGEKTENKRRYYN